MNRRVRESIAGKLLGRVARAASSAYVTDKTTQAEKRKARMTKDTHREFLEDFIEDFTVDFSNAMKSNVINPVLSGTKPVNDAGTDFDKVRLKVTSAIQKGEVKNKPQLGAFLAKNYPDLWKNTADKNGLLTKLLPTELQEAATIADTLNLLVEATIAEAPEESISSWIMRWFEAYMKGVDWVANQRAVRELALIIEKRVKTEQEFDDVIQKLANKSWDIVSAQNEIPFGAQDVMSWEDEDEDIAPSLSKADLAALAKLKKSDPEAYKKMVATGKKQ